MDILNLIVVISFLIAIIGLLFAVRVSRREALRDKARRDDLGRIEKLASMTDSEKIESRKKMTLSNIVNVTVEPPKTLKQKIVARLRLLYLKFLFYPDDVPKVIIRPSKR